MRIRSRLTKVLAAATAVAALAACGSSGNSSSGGASSSAGAGGGSSSAPAGGSGSSTKPVTLTWFMWSGSNEEVNAWKHVGDLVHQKYPNITVQFQTTSFNNYWTKLTRRRLAVTHPVSWASRVSAPPSSATC